MGTACNYKHFLRVNVERVPCEQVTEMFCGFLLQVVPENGFEVLRRVFVDFEGISLRRKFLSGLEPENIHMMIGKILFPSTCFIFGTGALFTELFSSSLCLGSMTIDCLGILNDLSDCEDKLFPIGYQ